MSVLTLCGPGKAIYIFGLRALGAVNIARHNHGGKGAWRINISRGDKNRNKSWDSLAFFAGRPWGRVGLARLK
jgi:hypothetical protein